LPINNNAPNQPPPTPVTANADGTYPNVFNNVQVDANFGVTSPIYLGQITPAGTTVSTTDLTALTGITTSFSSKSEMALNLSTNRNAQTFLGYNSVVGALDVSNSNTPNHVDPSNTDTQTLTNRSVVQINGDGTVQVTNTNAYSGTTAAPPSSRTKSTALAKASTYWPAMPATAARRLQPLSSTTPACSL
jgi:hypothetical protein